MVKYLNTPKDETRAARPSLFRANKTKSAYIGHTAPSLSISKGVHLIFFSFFGNSHMYIMYNTFGHSPLHPPISFSHPYQDPYPCTKSPSHFCVFWLWFLFLLCFKALHYRLTRATHISMHMMLTTEPWVTRHWLLLWRQPLTASRDPWRLPHRGHDWMFA